MPTGAILVVDDEPQNLAAIRRILGNDYPLVFARNGREALEAVAKHSVAMILLDIVMPDMNGYAVCSEIKCMENMRDVPVIFISALTSEWDESRGFACGAVDYITKPLSPVVVRARVKAHLSLVTANRLERSHRDAITMLAVAGHWNDVDTGVHIWRMAAIAKALARLAGWDAHASQMLELAAQLHDTGKIGIPGSILRKPGPLTPEERAIINTHTVIGHDILARSDAPIFRMAAEVALNHHEKWDGSGYPNGLAGEAIPQSARIVALADVFDALAMRRIYKEAWPIEDIAAMIRRSSGSHFEPGLVDIFLEHLDDFVVITTQWANGQPRHD